VKRERRQRKKEERETKDRQTVKGREGESIGLGLIKGRYSRKYLS
jgi:hypothetical protein